VIIDHGHGDVPAVLLAFGDDLGGDLLRACGVDVGAIVRAPVLRGCGGGTGGECGGEQNGFHVFPLPLDLLCAGAYRGRRGLDVRSMIAQQTNFKVCAV
jgi:hypothetical protein